MEVNMKKTIKVVAAVIENEHEEILCALRSPIMTMPNLWEFPGGKREKGESFRECVKREIEEEVGLKISVRPHFFEVIHDFEKTQLVLRFHRCQIQAGEPKSLEGQKLDWVAPNEFDNVNFLKTNHGVLQKLKGMRV